MNDRTTKGIKEIRGRDPQLLVEKIIRERIYECMYWKEKCFGVNAETILDLATQLDYVGGTFGNQRPSPFLCLLLKLLQIQPSSAVLEEYIVQDDFKYLRILGLFYARMTLPSAKVYHILEPYLQDRSKLRMRQSSGSFVLKYMDEVIDELLTEDRVFDLILPRLTKRIVLEDAEELSARPQFFELEEPPAEESGAPSLKHKETISTTESS